MEMTISSSAKSPASQAIRKPRLLGAADCGSGDLRSTAGGGAELIITGKQGTIPNVSVNDRPLQGIRYCLERLLSIKSVPDSHATAVPAEPESISGVMRGAAVRTPANPTRNNIIPTTFIQFSLLQKVKRVTLSIRGRRSTSRAIDVHRQSTIRQVVNRNGDRNLEASKPASGVAPSQLRNSAGDVGLLEGSWDSGRKG